MTYEEYKNMSVEERRKIKFKDLPTYVKFMKITAIAGLGYILFFAIRAILDYK